MKKKYWLFLVLILADVLIGTKVYGVISANKTWQSSEILTASDLNAEYTHNRAHIKENRDMILGDSAEGTGYSGHDHEGTNGVRIDADAMADDDWGDFTSSSQVFSLDANVVAGSEIANGDYGDVTFSDGNCTLDTNVVTMTKFSNAVQRYILSQRIKHIELVYEDTDNITVSFPWTEIGGTAWSNVTGIDVSSNEASGGNVKDGTTANQASTWYYLYISNSFTITQPIASEFRFTTSTSESSYTYIGAVYNDSGQDIYEFDQFGGLIQYRDPINALSGGSSVDPNGADVTLTIPANCNRALIDGSIQAKSTGAGLSYADIQVWKNEDETRTLYRKLISNLCNVDSGSTFNRTGPPIQIITDSSQKIEYKIVLTDANAPSAGINVYGYFAR